jgi:transcription antitermination factor NusG
MSLNWYVLRSKPNKEIALWREVCARGLECYYPQLHVRPADPRNRKVRPYFPGYMFLQAEVEQVGVSTFQWMPYSSGLVCFDEQPAMVPAHLVQGIRRHVDELNARRVELLAGMQRGERVSIRGGPFDGHEAIFDARLPGRERVRVLLRLLDDLPRRSREVPVELPVDQVEPLRVRSVQNRR